MDQGRLTPAGRPEDADDPGNFRPRSADPARQAAAAFAGFLGADGIRVTGATRGAGARRRRPPWPRSSSPPLSAIVGWMLRESNNVIAEDLARQVALARAARPRSAARAAAVTAVLRRLGAGRDPPGRRLRPVTAGPDRPRRAAAWSAWPRRRSIPRCAPPITGMPVAGFSGTLAPGQSVFGGIGGPARGLVRAKTGNLSTVATLAGLVYDSNGRVLASRSSRHIPTAASLQTAADTINAAADPGRLRVPVAAG